VARRADSARSKSECLISVKTHLHVQSVPNSSKRAKFTAKPAHDLQAMTDAGVLTCRIGTSKSKCQLRNANTHETLSCHTSQWKAKAQAHLVKTRSAVVTVDAAALDSRTALSGVTVITCICKGVENLSGISVDLSFLT
jgi:hypothetical protein